MTEELQRLFLKLSRVNFSYQKFSQLLEANYDLTALQHAADNELKKMGFTALQIERWNQVTDEILAKDLAWLAETENHLLPITDAHYPELLKSIYDPPLVLYVKGELGLLETTQLAIVGSRNPSRMGAETAHEFANHLAGLQVVITSGMATGIDAASHKGALAAGGKTLAVCGTGLDRVYPAKHRELAQQIAASGALVSEFPLGTTAKPHHFPQRNRIISGLSVGCLVVEAALQSGSLITAKQALEQGREVFAVPGSIHNPLARGCHHLIRQGAKLVETASDIFEELPSLSHIAIAPTSLEKPRSTPILDNAHKNLLECVGFETTAVDVIVARSGLPVQQVSAMLLNLELNLLISSNVGGYIRNKGS